jgi:predicted Zn-dependent protease
MLSQRPNKFPSFVLFLVLLTAGCSTYNTATGRREFVFISTDSEVTMGRSFDAQVKHEFPESKNQEKTARLERIGTRVAQVSDRQDFQYHFTLIAKDEMNAFTVPGGYIYFFEGLYDKLSTDDEIAAVLAHEIGHSAARHTVKKYQAALGYDLVSRILFARFTSDLARQVASLGGGLIANIAMSAYGRQDEFEADRLGIKYMRLAGYDLNGMIRTFEILKKNSKGPEPPRILRTHPYIDDRIKAVEKEIQGEGTKY